MGMVLTSICVSSRICLYKEILSKPLIIGYDWPNVEDCKCQQFVKASQPLHFIKVSRTLLQSDVPCRFHNSTIYHRLLSIPLPYSFAMNKRVIASVQWSYPLDARSKFWASSTSSTKSLPGARSALGRKSVEI